MNRTEYTIVFSLVLGLNFLFLIALASPNTFSASKLVYNLPLWLRMMIVNVIGIVAGILLSPFIEKLMKNKPKTN